MIIETKRDGYGIGMDWILVAYGRRFYLGQDVKFCSRVLGMEPKEVIDRIGTNRIHTKTAKTKIARLIVDTLGITRSNIKDIEPWGICAH